MINIDVQIIKKFDDFMDNIIRSQREAEMDLIEKIINTPGIGTYNNALTNLINKETFYKVFPEILYAKTMGNYDAIDRLIKEINLPSGNIDIWERLGLDYIDIKDKMIQGTLAETIVDKVFLQKDDYIINIGQDIINKTFDSIYDLTDIRSTEATTKDILLEPVYEKNWNGDFAIKIDGKIAGYLDIKNTNFFDKTIRKFRTDPNIIDKVFIKGVKSIDDWNDYNEILTWILKSLTFDYKIGYKNQPTNRELIYVLRDGGYWSSKILELLKAPLKEYLLSHIYK